MAKSKPLALEFPNFSARWSSEAIVLQSQAPLQILSSAVVGGGLTRARVMPLPASTDAVVVACTGRGKPLFYAGPATTVGWLIGRCVRKGL